MFTSSYITELSLSYFSSVHHTIRSTLTIERVTEKLFDNVYECVAYKIDIPTVYADRLTENLHTAYRSDREYRGIVSLPNTTEYQRLTYYNNDMDKCNLNQPCQISTTITLLRKS